MADLGSTKVYGDLQVTGDITGNVTGNADTATKLQTARTIGGVSFDGSANINLPGVNTAGNQSTTGNAATATRLATARTINGVNFDGTANITVNAVDATARIAASEKGAANGIASLDASGKVPAAQLPSYVDDVLEFATMADFPTTGESSKMIYIAIDSGKIYRWTGSVYVNISANASTADAAVKLATARSISITGDATWTTSFDGSANATGALTLANSGVTAGTYQKVTVDAKGRVTAGATLAAADIPALDASKITSGTLAAARIPTLNQNTTGSAASLTTARTISITGDATWSTSFNGSANVTGALTLANSGVTAGTYPKVTVDAKGRVTAGSSLVATDVPALDASKITSGVFPDARLSGTYTGVNITGNAGSADTIRSTFVTSNTVGSYSNQYTKFLTITIPARYGDYDANLRLLSYANGGQPSRNSDLYIRVKQQNAFGSNPSVDVDHLTDDGDYAGIGYVITSNAGPTVVDFYIKNTTVWNVIAGFLFYKTTSAGGTGKFLSTQGFSASVAGIVDITTTRRFSDKYKPKADALTTARTIGGVSFDGTTNINLPGVNTAGNQSTTGNAATATKLATARTINGVAFDGSTNITINAVDSTARIAASEKGVANGVATLDANGMVPAGQLPSYVDDVLEFADQASFPVSGESGKIYVAVDTGKIYRWSGSAYVNISANASTADAAVKLATARSISITGDATWSTSFDGSANATGAITLANSGVTAGTYGKVTVDAKGRVTAGASMVEADVPALSIAKTTGLQAALDGKVDKAAGQSLMLDAERTKLSGIEAGAQVNVATNLAQSTRTATTVLITSSTGTNATLSAATTSQAGVMASADKSKLDGIAAGAQVNSVTSVAGKTGAVTLAKGDVGLANVDNTSDAAKPVSTATQTALDLKANLSSPAFTGTPTVPTQSAGDNSTRVASTAFVKTALDSQTHAVATPSTDGFMSAADKARLDSLSAASGISEDDAIVLALIFG